MTFAVKTKNTQFNPIRREKRYKRQISRQRSRSKEGRRQSTDQNSNWERERERERERHTDRQTDGQTDAKLETTHHPHWLSSSPLWRKRLTRKTSNTPLLSALVTSDWQRARKSNNPTTIKHRTFFYFLLPYQHVFTNPAIWTFYLFVSNTIVKLFTCLRVLCFRNCAYFFPCNHILI